MNHHRKVASILKYLEQRADIIRAIRQFFYGKGYLEVETPIRIPNPIPEEHIDPFQSEGWYLQSSPEICMKRLAAQGYSKIFQICKCFRKDERGDRHLTEFTMLEWYRKDYSYMELMDECRDMIRYVADKLISNKTNARSSSMSNVIKNRLYENGLYIDYGSNHILLSSQWERITVSEAFKKYARISMQEAEQKGTFDEIMAFEIEPNLGLETPTFIYDYPASRASLAKLKSENFTLNANSLAERFELYISGIEIANGFSELTDPVEQVERLEKEIIKIEQRHIKEGKNISTYSKLIQIPEKFIKDLKKLPPTAGIALGVDRLVMILTNAITIDELVAFTPEEL
ncbi:MAG: EF-P lysine aminoacylase GenX [Desulfamplus sp.]|nr:EF-P lysine aminoacylase GenX [Desulfamplus sp.]